MEDFVFERHLKEFNTSQECEDYIENNEIEGPYVYYVKDTEVIYCPNEKIQLVDMGLPSGTLWATDVIKNSDGEPLYFAWGETSGYSPEEVGVKKSFGLWDYEFEDENNYTKYNGTDGLTELEPEDDAATQILGADYQIPSKAHWYELLDNCDIYISNINLDDDVDYDEIEVELVSKINGNTIILKSYSWCNNGECLLGSTNGYYYRQFILPTNDIYETYGLYSQIFGVVYYNYYSNLENYAFYPNGSYSYPIVIGFDNNGNLQREYGYTILPIKKGNYVPQIPDQQDEL